MRLVALPQWCLDCKENVQFEKVGEGIVLGKCSCGQARISHKLGQPVVIVERDEMEPNG